MSDPVINQWTKKRYQILLDGLHVCKKKLW